MIGYFSVHWRAVLSMCLPHVRIRSDYVLTVYSGSDDSNGMIAILAPCFQQNQKPHSLHKRLTPLPTASVACRRSSTGSSPIRLPSPPLLLHHRTPTHYNLIQRHARNPSMHNVNLPSLAHTETTRFEPGDTLLTPIHKHQIASPDPLAFPSQPLAERQRLVSVRAREDAFGLKGHRLLVQLKIDRAGPVVECGRSHGGSGGGSDGQVWFGAEHAPGVLVHFVQRVRFVRVRYGHVAMADAIAVDVEDARSVVVWGGRTAGSADFAHRRAWSGFWRAGVWGCLVFLRGRHFVVQASCFGRNVSEARLRFIEDEHRSALFYTCCS